MILLNVKNIFAFIFINNCVKFISVMLLIKMYLFDLVNNNKYYISSKTKHAVVEYSYINLLNNS